MVPIEVFENIKSLVVPKVNLKVTPVNPVTKFIEPNVSIAVPIVPFLQSVNFIKLSTGSITNIARPCP